MNTMPNQCPGTGRQWQPGMGSPICPTCKRGIKSLTGSHPKNPIKFLQSGHKVPAHEARKP
jgi:hypothetical protein